MRDVIMGVMGTLIILLVLIVWGLSSRISDIEPRVKTYCQPHYHSDFKRDIDLNKTYIDYLLKYVPRTNLED